MPRTLSAELMEAIHARDSGVVIAFLLEVSSPGLATPIRVNNSGGDLTSGGVLYSNFPFDLVLPADSEDSVPRVTLRIANADRSIVQAIRSVPPTDPLAALVSVVRAAAPDVVEIGPLEFQVRMVPYTAEAIEAELVYEPVLDEPFPAYTYTPSRAPGLF